MQAIASTPTYRRPLTDWRAAPGFTQHDYALRNASWHVTDIFAEMFEDGDRRDGFLDPLSMLRDGASERIEFETPEAASDDVKHVAKVVGADLVGIAPFDERWVYTERFSVQTGGGKPERPARRHDACDRDRPVDGSRAHPHRPIGIGRHGDRARVLARLGGSADDRPIHPQPRIPGDPVDERHGTGDPLRTRGRARRVRPPRTADHARVRTPPPARQDLHRHAAGARPTRSRSVSSDSATAAAAAPTPALRKRSPAAIRRPSSTTVRTSSACGSGRSTGRSASATGRRSTPTARCASASARTTATTRSDRADGG